MYRGETRDFGQDGQGLNMHNHNIYKHLDFNSKEFLKKTRKW